MEIKYILKSKNKVTKSEEIQLETLRYLSGHIWPQYLKQDKLGMVILAKIKNRVIGWGLIFERNEEKTLFLYISKQYRRLGVGTKIFKIAADNFGELYTSHHNEVAHRFFRSLE